MLEKCTGCFREWVYPGGVCKYCGTFKPVKKIEWPKSSGAKNSSSSSNLMSALPFFVAIAIFLYVWSVFDNLLYSAISSVIAWHFSESKLGQAILRLLVFFAGLGIAWFLFELSKTYK